MAGLADAFRIKVRRMLGLPEDPGKPPDLMRLGLYPAQIVAQNADGTLDVKPVNPDIPGDKNVRMFVGVAGATVKPVPGAVVLLGWEEGDPGKAFCAPIFYSGGSLLSLTIADQAGDALVLGNGLAQLKGGGAAQVNAGASGLALGTNPTKTPVLTVGAVDSMGVPVTNAPTNTGTVTAG